MAVRLVYRPRFRQIPRVAKICGFVPLRSQYGRLARMLWKNGGDTPERGAVPERERGGPIRIERDAPRPATILKVATELEERGSEIQELFKEIQSPWGEVTLPIHLVRGGRNFFVEVQTGPWDPLTTEEIIIKAAVLRDSEHAEAGLEIL